MDFFVDGCWCGYWFVWKVIHFGDLFLEKHRLLLGINKVDHVCCSSLQRRREDSQRCQLGYSFSSICHVEVSDKEKKCSSRTSFSKELSYSLLYSSCKGNEYLHDGLENTALNQHHGVLSAKVRLACYSLKAVSKLHFKLKSSFRCDI